MIDLSSQDKYGVKTTSKLGDVRQTLEGVHTFLTEKGYDLTTAVIRLDSSLNEDGDYTNRVTVYVDKINVKQVS